MSPDGKTVYTRWADYSKLPAAGDLVAIDVTTGERRLLTHGEA
jgi:hypothetical protein